jgi:tetratricopeptide (TPR) repeat protein
MGDSMRDIKVLSIGDTGNAEIDVIASSSFEWCDGLYLKPHKGARDLMPKEEIDLLIDSLKLDVKKYSAILVWQQGLSESMICLLNKILKVNPSILIIGNSHGYNKSISEVIELYKLRVPQFYMDYYSMWGQYFTDRYKRFYKKDPYKEHLLSLGSLRHDYLYKNFCWNKNNTNGKVLVIHEVDTSEAWNDPSPIGDYKVTESVIEILEKNNIPFDLKVHPNWPDFISSSGKPMWRPPSSVNVVNIPIPKMVDYEAIIASWSSTQFDALAMGIPVINIKYDYPKVNNSEWGPGKLGLLKAVNAEKIPECLDEIHRKGANINMDLLKYFLGDLGKIGDTYYSFIQKHITQSAKFKRYIRRKNYILALEGIEFFKQHRYDEAIKIIERSLNGEPKNINACYTLGSCYQKKGEWRKAIEKFKRVLSIETYEPETYHSGAHFHLGEIYQILGEIDKAKLEFEKCLKINPTHKMAKKKLSEI